MVGEIVSVDRRVGHPMIGVTLSALAFVLHFRALWQGEWGVHVRQHVEDMLGSFLYIVVRKLPKRVLKHTKKV
jgi:hypothetical protein